MAQPLTRPRPNCCATGPTRERDRILVLVTDGQVGNEDQILRDARPAAEVDARLHARHRPGGERGVPETAGRPRRRRSELVESEERLDEVMDRVHRHIGTPVLTGLRLEPAGLAFVPGSVVPSRLPDLFAGTPLTILGRYRGAATGGDRLAGARRGRRHVVRGGRGPAGDEVRWPAWCGRAAGCASWRIATSSARRPGGAGKGDHGAVAAFRRAVPLHGVRGGGSARW